MINGRVASAFRDASATNLGPAVITDPDSAFPIELAPGYDTAPESDGVPGYDMEPEFLPPIEPTPDAYPTAVPDAEPYAETDTPLASVRHESTASLGSTSRGLTQPLRLPKAAEATE